MKTEEIQIAGRSTDLFGRTKITQHQNVYDADFEYGTQPLRWEQIVRGGGTITHISAIGGVRLRVGTALGDITIRQSRPYQRYQPGKVMMMSSAVNFGQALTNQVQRVGFFDDSNGVFFEQGVTTPTNPQGMYVVIRSDVNGGTNGVPVENRIGFDQWNFNAADNNVLKDTFGVDPDNALIIKMLKELNWTTIQMMTIEYTWYGAGSVRFGIVISGKQYFLHTYAHGSSGATFPWCRTGNLPVRYEQRNIGVTAQQNDMFHWGVSVLVDGGIDDQRGFTYSYGMTLGTPRRLVAAATTRFPLLSIRMRVMGTIEFTQASSAITAGTTTSLTVTGTPFTVNQWQGKFVNYIVSGVSYVAKITSNTTSVLTLADVVSGTALSVAPVAGQNYIIGLINRGQLLPKKLLISSDALAQCEVFCSTPSQPIVVTGGSFVSVASLGSANSFAELNVTSTSFTGGERIKKFTLPAGGSGLQEIDLSDLFPLYNTISGATPDIMTLAITTQSGVSANVGADFDAQEAMS